MDQQEPLETKTALERDPAPGCSKDDTIHFEEQRQSFILDLLADEEEIQDGSWRFVFVRIDIGRIKVARAVENIVVLVMFPYGAIEGVLGIERYESSFADFYWVPEGERMLVDYLSNLRRESS